MTSRRVVHASLTSQAVEVSPTQPAEVHVGQVHCSPVNSGQMTSHVGQVHLSKQAIWQAKCSALVCCQQYTTQCLKVCRYKLIRIATCYIQNSALSPVSTTQVHGPSSRPVNSGAFFDTRIDGCQKMHPSSRAVNSGRELGCQKMHPSSRAINSGRELGP